MIEKHYLHFEIDGKSTQLKLFKTDQLKLNRSIDVQLSRLITFKTLICSYISNYLFPPIDTILIYLTRSIYIYSYSEY